MYNLVIINYNNEDKYIINYNNQEITLEEIERLMEAYFKGNYDYDELVEKLIDDYDSCIEKITDSVSIIKL